MKPDADNTVFCPCPSEIWSTSRAGRTKDIPLGMSVSGRAMTRLLADIAAPHRYTCRSGRFFHGSTLNASASSRDKPKIFTTPEANHL